MRRACFRAGRVNLAGSADKYIYVFFAQGFHHIHRRATRFGEGDNAMHEQLSLITCPTLVTTGELDPGSTPAMSYALAEKISSATAFILPDARHMMPVEHACEVSALLHNFVAANSC